MTYPDPTFESWRLVLGLAQGLDRPVGDPTAEFWRNMGDVRAIWARAGRHLGMPRTPVYDPHREGDARCVLDLGASRVVAVLVGDALRTASAEDGFVVLASG